MGKFVIECSSCGKYAEVKTGLFAKKKVECGCGHIIDIKTEKMSTRTCPHCGNMFVYDQTDGLKVHCPVCKKKVITTQEDTKTVTFPCKQCGIALYATQGEKTCTCPVCDSVNDIEERMRLEQLKKDGLVSIIKYEGNGDTLVWKHPVEDFNMGSQLIVHESQEAIFFRDGQALDLFGAGRYTLETQQLPILEEIYKLPSELEKTFHSEVYFVNMATVMGVKWGTDTKVRLFDPASGMHVEIGASGEFNVRVANARKLLLKLVGTTGGLTQADLVSNEGKGFFRSLVMTQVKSVLASTITEKAIGILEIDARLAELSEALKEKINPILLEYGLEISEFFVARIVTPDDDPNFKRMKEQYAAAYLNVREEQIRRNVAEAEAQRRMVEAQTEAQMKIIGAQGDAEVLKIQRAAEAEAYRMQAQAEAEEMRMKGYTYQQETARQVSMEALKNGLTGNGEGGNMMGGMMGGIGEIASLGMTLGAMGSVVNMTKEAMMPVVEAASSMGQTVGQTAVNTGWNCQCGQVNITSNFCPNCGTKRPDLAWNCPTCGQMGITTNFCPNCGTKRN